MASELRGPVDRERTHLGNSLRSVQLLVRLSVETIAAVKVATVAMAVASRDPTGPTRCSPTPDWPHSKCTNPMYWQAHVVAPAAADNALAIVMDRHNAEHQRL